MKIARVGLICLLLVTIANAQKPVLYEISFPNAAHHEAEISVTYQDVSAPILEARMSRSSPGRYAIHEFAKNVYNVKAFNDRGKQLSITRPNPYQWNISGHNGTVQITYTLFADRAGGTYAGIDLTHAHLNIPATFMWARDMGDRPIEVVFNSPDGSNWKVATQLQATNRPNVFRAPNLYYFLDSPTELSDFSLREWEVYSNGKPQKIRIAMHHDGTEEELDVYANMTDAVVREELEVFGELPEFDFGSYTFIIDYLPHVSGDGMEHRNSTICTSTRSLRTSASRNIGTVAHEFFHAWNVERIRPKSLEPFDFEAANMSGELWFAEGFTSYYTLLVLKRTGINNLDRFLSSISGGLNYVINSPGRLFFSPVEMSMQAPFVDAATSVDPTNRSNTFISYYTYGSVVGLGLDLTLRTQFDNVDLDDYMRAVWTAHGKTEIPYTLDDLRTILGKVIQDQSFADSFFEKYIFGRDVVDYKSLLAHAGLLLLPANPDRPYIGRVNLDYSDDGATIRSSVQIGTPLYKAGLDRGDLIMEIDGKPMVNADDFEMLKMSFEPSDVAKIRFEQRGIVRESELQFSEDPSLEVVPYEQADLPVTQAMKDFRQEWFRKKSSFDSLVQKSCPTCAREYKFEMQFCPYDGEELILFKE